MEVEGEYTQVRNQLRNKITEIQERNKNVGNNTKSITSMTDFYEIITENKYSLMDGLDKNNYKMSESIPIEDVINSKEVDSFDLNKVVNTLVASFKMSRIFPSAVRIGFYEIEKADINGINDNDLKFNMFIYDIFYNWIENVLLYYPENNIFKKENFEKQFPFLELANDSSIGFNVIIDGELFSFNDFFNNFKDFSDNVDEIVNTDLIEKEMKRNFILTNFRDLIKSNPTYAKCLKCTIHLLLRVYLSITDSSLKIFSLSDLKSILMAVYSFTTKPNIHLFQILSNILNIRLNYLDLNEFTPNMLTFFPFTYKDSIPIPLMNIHISHQYPFHFILYDANFVLDMTNEVDQRILDEINLNNKVINKKNVIEAEKKVALNGLFSAMDNFTSFIGCLNKNDIPKFNLSHLNNLKESLQSSLSFINSSSTHNPVLSQKTSDVIRNLHMVNEKVIFRKISKFDTTQY